MIFRRLFNLIAWAALFLGLWMLWHVYTLWRAQQDLRVENLYVAAKAGDLSLINRILDSPVGEQVNQRDATGHTGLMWASRYGHAEIVRALLKRGADPNARSKEGETALSQAALGGHTAVVRLLVKAGAREGIGDALYWTAAKGDAPIVDLILDHGVSPNQRNSLGAGALLGAAEMGQLETAKILLQRKADVNARDPAGRTALALAAGAGKIDMVRFLLRHGASPAIKDRYGMTPSHRARERGQLRITWLLQTKNAPSPK